MNRVSRQSCLETLFISVPKVALGSYFLATASISEQNVADITDDTDDTVDDTVLAVLSKPTK